MAIVSSEMESDFDMMTFTTCTIEYFTSGHTADVWQDHDLFPPINCPEAPDLL